MSRRLALVTGAALAILLSGCGDGDTETGSPTPTTAGTATAAQPCLLGDDQLSEITGTPQELAEPSELETGFECETLVDERGVAITWGLRESSLNPPPSPEELRELVEMSDFPARQADFGGGVTGWLAKGEPVGLPEASAIALLEDRVLEVTATGTTTGGEDVPVDDLAGNTLEVARALVAAHGDQ